MYFQQLLKLRNKLSEASLLQLFSSVCMKLTTTCLHFDPRGWTVLSVCVFWQDVDTIQSCLPLCVVLRSIIFHSIPILLSTFPSAAEGHSVRYDPEVHSNEDKTHMLYWIFPNTVQKIQELICHIKINKKMSFWCTSGNA